MKIFVSTQVALARARRCLSSRRQLADTCSQQIALADFCCSCRLRHRHLARGRCCTGRLAVWRTRQPGVTWKGRKQTQRKQILGSAILFKPDSVFLIFVFGPNQPAIWVRFLFLSIQTRKIKTKRVYKTQNAALLALVLVSWIKN